MLVIITIILHTKFEMSSFIRSKDNTGVPKLVHMTLTKPSWGQLVISKLTLHRANSLAAAVAEIFYRGAKFKNMSCDLDHTPFRDDLTSTGCDLLPLT